MYAVDTSRTDALNFLTLYCGYDELAGRHIPGSVLLNDETLTAVNQFELDSVKEHFRLMRRWYLKGYIRPDAPVLGDTANDKRDGYLPMSWVGTMKPGINVEVSMIFGGAPVEVRQLTPHYLTTSFITAAMTAIGASAENPGLCMDFYNLLYTDRELYNILCHGLEGVHYRRLSGMMIEPVEGSGYMPNLDWSFGNQFMAYVKKGADESVWEETKEQNRSAIVSSALGFSFDPSPIQTEIVRVNAVKDEYLPMLATGAVDFDTVYPEFIGALKEAGSDTIIAELQRQLDAWKHAKGAAGN
jgi:Domain of unknown function (DUF3502).